MATNVALAIGIARSGSLIELPGAIAGARQFIEWASKIEDEHKYICHIVTDEQSKVTVSLLLEKISKIVEDDIGRLLLFYSGHGTTTNQGDYWLLSDWESNSNEVVSLNLSFNNAKRWPIR